MNEDKIIQKLNEHDLRFDKHERQLDNVVQKLLEHDGRLDRIEADMMTKKDFEILLKGQDQMMVILKRLDEEMVVNARRITKIEDGNEEQAKVLGKVKMELKIA